MNLATTEERELVAAVDDPVRFASGILGHDLWSTQRAIMRAVDQPRARVAVKACHASSKALALDTTIATPSGWTTMGEIEIGDLVYNEIGKAVPVVTVSPVMRKPSYRVTFCTGESIVASHDHLWAVIDLRFRPRTWKAGNGNRHRSVTVADWREHWDATRTVTTEDMAANVRVGDQYRWRIPTTRPLDGWQEWPLKTPPYTFGAWLGDGTRGRAALTPGDRDMAHFESKMGGTVIRNRDRHSTLVFAARPYLDAPSRETGGAKRIPIAVLRTSYEDRLAVLRGVMDTDGWVTRASGVSIGQMSLEVALGVRALAVSLGWKASWREQRAVLNGVDYGPFYVVSFSPDVCPFTLPRKVTKWQARGAQASRFTQRTVVSVDPVGEREVRCIGVASDRHLFLAGEGLIPTHNTYTAAEITIHALVKYKPVTVVTTAPTWHQVETLLWGEIHKALQAAPVKLPDLLAALNTTSIIIEKGVRFAEGISTTEAVRFQGYHAGEGGIVLIILDEAPGVRAEIFEAIDGIRAGGDVRVLMIGNPTIASGPFYDAFTSNREGWQTFTIGAFDTPNLAGLDLEDVLAMEPAELAYNERPYLISRQWVREMYDEWGPGHPLWQARVMGQFPDQAEDALYSLSWLEAARSRPSITGAGRCHAGLDVAGPGEDETSLWIREGSSILLAQHWSQADPRGEVTAALAPYLNRLDAVNVDATGIGHYMAAHLKDQGYPVRDVNVGESARDSEKFANLKAELYWSARERLEQGDVNGLVDDRAIAQLAGIRYSHNARGQVVIEKKEDARKRGAKSPDRAEGFILCFAPWQKKHRKPVGRPYERFGGKVSA